MTDTINSLEDVRPGDLYIGPIGGWIGVGVDLGTLALGEAFRAGKLSARHVGVVTREFSMAKKPQPGFPDGRGSRPPQMAQAMPGGAEIISLTQERHWTPRNAFVRLPEDYPGQSLDAAAVALAMVEAGVGYSFESYPLLAAWHWGIHADALARYIARTRDPLGVTLPSDMGRQVDLAFPVEAICSVFADQAWTLTGKEVMRGVPRQVVTPGALAGQLWHRQGVVWGGFGLL